MSPRLNRLTTATPQPIPETKEGLVRFRPIAVLTVCLRTDHGRHQQPFGPWQSQMHSREYFRNQKRLLPATTEAHAIYG
jgi:hypothetical protein